MTRGTDTPALESLLLCTLLGEVLRSAAAGELPAAIENMRRLSALRLAQNAKQ